MIGMPKRRKDGNKFTTISISWGDKEELRRWAEFKKETKNGKLYESDAEVFHKVLLDYSQNNAKSGLRSGHPTYPTIHQDTHQQD